MSAGKFTGRLSATLRIMPRFSVPKYKFYALCLSDMCSDNFCTFLQIVSSCAHPQLPSGTHTHTHIHTHTHTHTHTHLVLTATPSAMAQQWVCLHKMATLSKCGILQPEFVWSKMQEDVLMSKS